MCGHVQRYLFITITLLATRHPQLATAQLSNATPPPAAVEMPSASEENPSARALAGPPAGSLQDPLDDPPDGPDQLAFPVAHAVPAPLRAERPETVSDTLLEHDGVLDLDGHAVVTFGDRRIEADHLAYDTHTLDLVATGHVVLTGGANDERITATHGTYNLRTATGRFFDVSGSVGLRPRGAGRIATLTTAGTLTHNVTYTNGNPFLFTGRMVVKTGPQSYDVYDGTVTSCALPRPDWLLSGEHFQVADGEARARNSVFHLLGFPLLWLPYVTHPTDANERQSGLLIPSFGVSSTRGVYVGEQLYLVLNRSADLTVGAAYYSLRGWAQNASFRYRGAGLNFATARYSGLLDKLTGAANQGGEDILFAARRDLNDESRVAANLEYLSSYVYREAFTDNFNQAVTSDIVSVAYATREHAGYEFAGYADRYQGIKNIAQGLTPEQQVRIFHVPTLSAAGVDHPLGHSGLQFAFAAAASGLKRTQPSLITSGITERFDLRPELSYPIAAGGWHLDPAIAVRETVYSRSRVPGRAGMAPVESTAALARSDVELTLPVRPPVVAADFPTPMRLRRFFGPELRHTIAPELTYRRVAGIDNFSQVLRFDATDVVSDTDEVEYGVTQRLFRRLPASALCRSDDVPVVTANPALNAGPENGPGPGSPVKTDFGPQQTRTGNDCGREELLSWRLTQKYFIDQLFGGAVVNGRRNVFQTTLDLSGVSFLTEPRAVSPLVSRLRVRTSQQTELQWDFDLDIGAKKFTSSNVYLNVHEGDFFTGIGYARLDAPGRFYTEGLTPTTGVTSQVSDFNQLRFLLGYGSGSKRGFSGAVNLGLDLKALSGVTETTTVLGLTTRTAVPLEFLQYTAIQTAYNWNCCGIAVEYRKFELGQVRNTPGYRFNFTLANIGAAGDLRRTERLF